MEPISSEAKLALDIINLTKTNFIDLSNDSAFVGHPEWFADWVHLNETGSKIFTHKLIEKLKNKINTKQITIKLNTEINKSN